VTGTVAAMTGCGSLPLELVMSSDAIEVQGLPGTNRQLVTRLLMNACLSLPNSWSIGMTPTTYGCGSYRTQLTIASAAHPGLWRRRRRCTARLIEEGTWL
jgi:hypothetical protein